MSFNPKVSVRDHFRLESILFFPLLLLIMCIHTQPAWRVNRDWLKCLEIKLVKRKYKCADKPHHHEISCHLFTNLPLSTFSSIWSKFGEKNSDFFKINTQFLDVSATGNWNSLKLKKKEKNLLAFSDIFWKPVSSSLLSTVDQHHSLHWLEVLNLSC